MFDPKYRPDLTHRRDFFAELEGARDAAVDWDIQVDDDRQVVEAAVAQLSRSLEARAWAQRHLASLILLQHGGTAA